MRSYIYIIYIVPINTVWYTAIVSRTITLYNTLRRPSRLVIRKKIEKKSKTIDTGVGGGMGLSVPKSRFKRSYTLQ